MEKPISTRERIVNTARSLFAEKGYERTTTAEIAREAGISEGTIYRHFDSKKELLMECVIPVLENIFDTFTVQYKYHIHQEEDLRQLTIKALEMRMQFFQDNYQTFRILFSEWPYFREMLARYIESVFEQEKKLSGLISQMEEQGQIKRTRNYLLFGMGQVMSLWMYLNLKEWSKEDGMEFSSNMLNEMINISHETLLPDLADYILYGISGVPENRR